MDEDLLHGDLSRCEAIQYLADVLEDGAQTLRKRFSGGAHNAASHVPWPGVTQLDDAETGYSRTGVDAENPALCARRDVRPHGLRVVVGRFPDIGIGVDMLHVIQILEALD